MQFFYFKYKNMYKRAYSWGEWRVKHVISIIIYYRRVYLLEKK